MLLLLFVCFFLRVVTPKKSVEGEDFYQVLGVKKTATTDEISNAYKKLAKKWHPDRFTESEKKEEATENFKKISEAFTTLKNPKDRKEYDRGGAGPRFHRRGGPDPFQTFEKMFRRGGPGGGFRFVMDDSSDSEPAEDPYKNMEKIDLNELQDKIDNNPGDPFVLYFYQPNCKGCVNIKDQVLEVHGNFQEIVNIYAVNCASLSGQKICRTQGVKKSPTFKFFGPQVDLKDRKKLEPQTAILEVNTNSNRVKQEITNWLSTQLPSYCKSLTSPKLSDVQNWLLTDGREGGRVPILVLTRKKGVSSLLKRVSLNFRMRVNILVLNNVQELESLRNAMNVQDYPVMSYYNDPINFQEMETLALTNKPTFAQLSQFLRRVIEISKETSKSVFIGEYSRIFWDAGQCQKTDTKYCLFYYANSRTEHNGVLADLGQRFQEDPLRLYFLKRSELTGSSSFSMDTSFPEAAKLSNELTGSSQAALFVFYRPKKNRYALISISSPEESQSLVDFVDNRLHSGIGLPLKASPLLYSVKHDEL